MDNVEQNIPNQIFFKDTGKEKKSDEKSSSGSSSGAGSGTMEFVGKGANRRLDEPWNIHFTIGSQTFVNLITLINEIEYDALFLFKKKELIIISIDKGTTHASTIKFEKTEFSDYVVKGLEKDDDEKTVYIDISIIIDELSINENNPIDFYIDTLEKNRFYVINGKEIVRKQLTSTNVGAESILQKYKNFLAMMDRLIKDGRYQKVIANQVPLSILTKSLSKKKSQKKDSDVVVDMLLNKNELDFRIEDEVRGSSIVLSGEDVMVYPIEDDRVRFMLDYIIKFGKLKLTYNVAMYLCGEKIGISNSLPIILESRFGGGRITCSYLIAPRVDEDN